MNIFAAPIVTLGANKPLYLFHPEFEAFDAIQTIRIQMRGSGR
jgi:hypothetical protein